MRAADDPLGIGGGDVPSQPENSGTELCGGVDLLCCFFSGEFGWMWTLAKSVGPVAMADEKAQLSVVPTESSRYRWGLGLAEKSM